VKRGGPLKRTKPLVAKKPLTARKGLKAMSAPKSSGRLAGPTRDVVEAVYERGQWCCERDGVGLGPVRGVDHHIHHRRLKGRGGTDKPDAHLPQNLLLLCPPCHELVHGPGRALMVQCGWIVPSTGDPAAAPVVLYGPRQVWLTPDGSYSPHPPRWKEGEAP
jgi:hypothetical protein